MNGSYQVVQLWQKIKTENVTVKKIIVSSSGPARAGLYRLPDG